MEIINQISLWIYLTLNSLLTPALIGFYLYALGTLMFVWLVLKRFHAIERKIDNLDVKELWDVYASIISDYADLSDRFELMHKDIKELQIRYSVVEAGNSLEEAIKTYIEYNKKPVKKGKK